MPYQDGDVMPINKETSQRYRDFKDNSKCLLCPEKDPVVLEFHHKDPKTKTDSVGNMVHIGMSWYIVYAEICKCVVLCSNCHKKVHAGRIAL
jgi:hypothetical protein